MDEITLEDKNYLQRFMADERMVRAVQKILDGVFVELRDDAMRIADQGTNEVRSNAEMGELLRAYGVARKRLKKAFIILEAYKKVGEEKSEQINPGL